MSKRPFDIDIAMERIGEAVRPFKKAALFELADEGLGSVFEILIACIISIRTYDETTLVCARRLFELARTPEAMSRLSPERIDEAIGEEVLGGDQPPAGPLRQARLHGRASEVLGLPGARHVPAGGGGGAPVTGGWWSVVDFDSSTYGP